jgi:hypothetical protein
LFGRAQVLECDNRDNENIAIPNEIQIDIFSITRLDIAARLSFRAKVNLCL